MRIRVHELARELGVDSPRVLAELRKMGEFVKSASSVLDPAVAAAVRSSFNSSPAQSSRRNPFTSQPPSRLPSVGTWGTGRCADPPPPKDDELTAAEAAIELGVRQSTIRQWVHRGYLTSSGVRGRARLYERADLQRANAQAKAKARRPAPPFAVPRELTRRPVSTGEAAQIAGVAPSTIRMWVHRGLLQPLTAVGSKHTFDPIEVLRVARRL
ncbi:translation initiation factor IF-2 N-terminal domain-containing protein [Georgenia sp. MJ173]|uniref:translation initiation factor IF-2 N-terminal domain-containing protein n=1 Tax=Georgenia sunbinii TaxID=3117728 RepID=UPI002F26A99E